jgi:hypothetical protein
MKPCLASTILLLAASNAGTATAQTLTPLDLPQGYRTSAAIQLARDYLNDAIGPAEINPEPTKIERSFVAMTFVRVRYPVRQTGLFGGESVAMRCIMIATTRTPRDPHSTRVRVSRPKQDPDQCEPKDVFVAYKELEQMAAKLRKCKEKGEERCLLVTNMPETQAKKLINKRP